MSPLPVILICDRDAFFCEALRNFLFAAGYSQVEVAVTVREALAKLRRECYGYTLIGVSRPLSRIWRLARVVQRRQPRAKIIFLVSADDQPLIEGSSFEYVIKEYVFSNLLDLI